MPDELHVRRATAHDRGVVLDLLAEGASFARARGIDQWPERFPPQFVLAGIERSEVVVASVDGVVVGTMSLAWSDPVFWGGDDGRAGYVHRLAVSAERRGIGLGRRLLDWAQDQVGQAHRSLLRLDCLAHNGELRRWYETLGFVHQGDRDVPGPLGAPVAISLYQRPMSPDRRMFMKTAGIRAALPAQDPGRAKAFYVEKVGLQAVESPFLEASDGQVGLLVGDGGNTVFVYPAQARSSGEFTQVVIEVTDVRAAVEQMRARGVTFEDYDTPETRTENGIARTPDGGEGAWFRDSEGNLVGIVGAPGQT